MAGSTLDPFSHASSNWSTVTKRLGRICRDTQVAEAAAGDVFFSGWCEAMVTASGGGATEDTGGGRGGTTGSI